MMRTRAHVGAQPFLHAAHRGGFTLPEVLLALSVILVAALPIIANLAVAVGARRVAQRETQAAALADQLAAAMNLSIREVLREQSGRAPGTTPFDPAGEHVFWNPPSRDPNNPADPFFDLTDPVNLEEFDRVSRFHWLHAGYFQQRWSQLNTNASDFGGAVNRDTAPLEPYFEFGLEDTGFDARVLARVSRWRYEIRQNTPEGNPAPNPEEDVIELEVVGATPLEYEYAVFLFDEDPTVPPDLEAFNNTQVAEEVGLPTERRTTFSHLDDNELGVNAGVFLSGNSPGAPSQIVDQAMIDGTRVFDLVVREPGSKVMIERMFFSDALRVEIADVLSDPNTGNGVVVDPFTNLIVDAELQRQGYTRAAYRSEFVPGRRPTVRTPDDVELYQDRTIQERPAFNLYTLPTRVYAIIPGKVQL